MEVYEAIRTVLAVREFQSRLVPQDVIQKIVESARLTASSKNGQPWNFVVIQNRDTLMKLGSLVKPGPYNAQAAFSIAVAIDKSSPFGISDASRAIQSMVLTAWSEGVGSNWTGWVGMTNVAALLEIPDDLDVVAVVPFGYPLREHSKGKKRRKGIGEIAHRELFGRPLSIDDIG